jgi:DNA replication protein DnaC
MSVQDDLIPLLKKLRLSGILQTLDLRTRQAVEDQLAYPEFLYRLAADEVERRDAGQLVQRLRRACFEQTKTIEDFDFSFNPSLPKAKILDLATCQFIARQENVLLVGPCGVGKSHVAQSIGNRACRAGYSVLYTGAEDMFTLLRAARADDSYERKLQRFLTPQLLIVDDLGLRRLKDDEPLDLYKIIRQRYERAATLLTTNRAVDELLGLFGDPLLASTAVDRLLHHSHVLVLEGESYRNPQRPRSKAAKGVGTPSK